MSAKNVQQGELSAVKRALLEIRQLRARLADAEAAAREPIAIVGLGLRIPGGIRDLSSFAHQLWSGKDAITEIPPDRWPLERWYDESQDAPGKMTTRFGGFIDEVDGFDAEFFGISPLEAASMDPQQRLVLELAWEALENAGHAPTSLAGSRAGVYLGIANGDYGRALFSRPELIDPYFSSGTSYSVASGRLAYLLDLRGPAVSIDTACSSSLVAVHLACQALRSGECELAIAGGVNVILSPEIHVNFSKAGMMAPDGRCKTFDAAADGYVRSEGGVLLVLRRLRDALADGDYVHAVIRGSAINQDGRSNGLTAPNGPAQEAVLRSALLAAGVRPREIGYIEAHGTGTSLGDPIEVNALGAVFAEGREASRPLLIGSVKTNIGHLEAAAGVAGLVKVVLALQRREVPPHLHLRELNPLIDWNSLPIGVPTAVTPLPDCDGRRLAGVSSFGFSGTNAHVILEEAPPPSAARDTLGAPRVEHLLTLSARDFQALGEIAARYVRLLEEPQFDSTLLGDLCFTANAGRSHFARRLAIAGASAQEMVDALRAFQRGDAHPCLTLGEVGARAPRVALLFPGQGPQYAGMGRQLYETAPAFRAALDECAAMLDPFLERPILSVIFGGPEEAQLLDQTAYAQPAMFAMEYALATLWRSWGVEVAAVMGHSFGEYAAACVAGVIQLADAARMVAVRGRLVQALPRNGAMIVLEAAEEAVAAAIAEHGGQVSIAAVNGPSNTVISGEKGAVEAIAVTFAGAGARTKTLRVSHAFHSPLVDPVLDEFEREIARIRFSTPRVPLVSTLTGTPADLALVGNPGYWREHMRCPVRFADAIRTLSEQGITHFIEASPHPVLLGMGAECADGMWLPSLREGQPAWPALLDSVRQLYCAGLDFDWQGFDRGMARRRTPLPTYPFQRRRHWIGTSPAPAPGAKELWSGLERAMDHQAERGPLDLNALSYPAKWDCLARLTGAHAIRTLQDAGLFAGRGERHTLDEVMSLAGIGETYRKLVRRWLEGLAERGLLRRDGETFVADAPLPDPGLNALWEEAEKLFADNRPLLAYVRHCASLVGKVLRGQESPLETLFPGGSFQLAQDLYECSTTMRYINGLARAAFDALAAATPARVLRVLEIGGGTGGTTSALLPALPAHRTRYLFTDVSDVFLGHARERFAEYPFVEYGLFDIDADFENQGYSRESFDIIVAANAVHAAKDLRAALERLRGLLGQGGALVLVESTTHLTYFDMTTGLIEGWQHFADDLRGDNPLLPPARWLEALKVAGFERARAWPSDDSAAAAIAQHVIVACAPGELDAVSSKVDLAARSKQDSDAGASSPAADSAADAWLERLRESVPAERLDLLRELVRSQVVSVMRLDPTAPPARHERLMDLGMDSLMAVQLRNALTRALGLARPLPATLMFDYPTIDAIAQRLLEMTEGIEPGASISPNATSSHEPLVLGEAAVAGMSDDEIALLLEQRLGDA